MGTPRTASTTLLIGAVALAVGSGLLVIRRQRLA
jgi:LPXTG-motif cell wall-anchored protein